MIPEFPIIDSHVHFYDTCRPEGVVWPPAETSFPPSAFSNNLIESAKPVDIDGVVLVETGFRRTDDEWLLKLAEHDSLIFGVIANLQPGEDGFEERLESYSKHPKLKGIRLRPIDQYNLNCHELRRHLKLLANYGMTLELGATSHKKVIDFISLATELSDVTCGLTHFGHPVIDGNIPQKEWREDMLQVADLPNAFCKFTSLSEFAKMDPIPKNPEYYRPIVEFLIGAFGEDRVIFGSNWPNRAIAGEYKANVGLYLQILKGNDIAIKKLTYKNAVRIYDLKTSA